MDSVLSIEPIIRSIGAPLTVGQTEHIFYGNGELDSYDNLGSPSCHMCIGAPLEAIDTGSSHTFIPLVKTFEMSPDFTRDRGSIFTENIYFRDKNRLIPFRTKIRSGQSKGMRFNHLPSLNYVRKQLVGFEKSVCDPKAEIVSDLLNNDKIFREKSHHPIMDWVRDDLIVALSNISVNHLNFDTEYLRDLIYKYSYRITDAPCYDLSHRYLKDIVLLLTHNPESIPLHFISDRIISSPLIDFKTRMVPHGVDLRSSGNLNIDHLPMVKRNPKYFTNVLEFIDKLPFTDLNVDVILADGDIVHAATHVVKDRMSEFEEGRDHCDSPEDALEQELHSDGLLDIVCAFREHDVSLTDEIRESLIDEPVKIKIIKTISDESVILLYKYDSGPNDKPLCGAYFDIAALSLAPISVIPTATLD